MRATGPRVQTERGLERLVNFSDAVVAIAITLVVLPLVDEVPKAGFGAFFAEHSFGLLAAGISFASIAASWRDHHRLFERATGYSRILVRLNFLWLLSIVFLPLAAVLLVEASHRDENAALTLYIGTLCATVAFLNLEELELLRQGDLSDARRPSAGELAARWLPLVLRLIALGIAVAVPAVHLWGLLIIVLDGPLQRLAERRAEQRAARAVRDARA